MRYAIRIAVLITVCMLAHSHTVVASGRVDTLKQWIAPLECTHQEIVDGVNTNVILTPKECDTLLNPPVIDPGTPTPGTPPVPTSPKTGVGIYGAIDASFFVVGLLISSALWTIWRAAIEQRQLYERLRTRKRK